ncbi:MAG: glycosyltransferase family 2 protein [Planctomycetota bacterium]
MTDTRTNPDCPGRILVAVPVYNEQQYVMPVIQKITEHASCVLVVDDGSTDYTPMLLAMQPVDVIRHKTNLGYGRSLRDAFRWAQSYNFDWLITMDCDEQHEPESLPDFYRAIADDDADIISGSRYLTPQNGNGDGGSSPPIDRRQINHTITTQLNADLGLSLTDAFCGFRAYRVATVEHDAFNVDGYAIPLQQWVQAAAKQLRIREVPIKLIYNDPNRSFGGPLDNPEERLRHYLDVYHAELHKYKIPHTHEPTPA